jgi:hypothetical protein
MHHPGRLEGLATALSLLLVASAGHAALAGVRPQCVPRSGPTMCDQLPELTAAFPVGWNTSTPGGRASAFACQLRIHQQELGLTDAQLAYAVATVWRESKFQLVAEAAADGNRCRCPPECTPATTCKVGVVRGRACEGWHTCACTPA